MIKAVLASRNCNKVREFREILSDSFPGKIALYSLDEIGFSGEIEENGSDFAENALIKAKTASVMGYIGIGDDSGLCVDILGGRPGVLSARYSGEGTEGNNRKLLEEMKNVPREKRTAHFVCSICCCFPDGRKPIVASGRCDGFILEEPRGKNGFGYDPLFWVPQFGKSFAELTPEEKNSVSHRGKAVSLFLETLKESGIFSC